MRPQLPNGVAAFVSLVFYSLAAFNAAHHVARAGAA